MSQLLHRKRGISFSSLLSVTCAGASLEICIFVDCPAGKITIKSYLIHFPKKGDTWTITKMIHIINEHINSVAFYT